MDIKAVFTEFCGPSVLFVAETHSNPHTLKITYSIPALDPDDRRFAVAHLRNGLETVLRQAVKRCADHARLDAYNRTGHREADMARLLSGRTV
jgi:hypothetical protein